MKLNKYEVWSEGYVITGNSSGAIYHGIFDGESFKDACDNWALTLEDVSYYNGITLSYWGCRLFDNEDDARKSFG